MVKRLLLLIFLSTAICSCSWLKSIFSPSKPDPRHKPIEWKDEPVGSMQKIQVVTNIPIKDLKDYYTIQVIKMGFRPNTKKIYKDHFSSLMKRHENYYVRLDIVFNGDTAIFSGQYGNRGIGSYYNSMSGSEDLREEDIDWNNITYDVNSWTLLTRASAISPVEHPFANAKFRYGF